VAGVDGAVGRAVLRDGEKNGRREVDGVVADVIRQPGELDLRRRDRQAVVVPCRAGPRGPADLPVGDGFHRGPVHFLVELQPHGEYPGGPCAGERRVEARHGRSPGEAAREGSVGMGEHDLRRVDLVDVAVEKVGELRRLALQVLTDLQCPVDVPHVRTGVPHLGPGIVEIVLLPDGRLELPDRKLVLSGFAVGLAETQIARGVVGGHQEDLHELPFGPAEIARLEVDLSQGIAVARIGIQLDGLLVLGQGLVVPAFGVVQFAQPDTCGIRRGAQLDEGPEGLDGPFRLAHRHVDARQHFGRLGGISCSRRQRDGRLEGLDGGAVVLFPVEFDAPVQGVARVVLELPVVELRRGEEPVGSGPVDGRHGFRSPVPFFLDRFIGRSGAPL